MLDEKDIKIIKETVEEFFKEMTIAFSDIKVSLSSIKKDSSDAQGSVEERLEEHAEVVDIDIKIDEPQILIGQQGQTLFETQRLLRNILNKKLSRSQDDRGSSTPSGQKIFYLNLDINDYKKKKVEYLKDLAKSLADQVSLTKEERALLPMSSYERRVIHSELSQRTDVFTESQGDGFDRHIVIKPR